MDHSACLLLYRRASELEVFLGHFGGPYWWNKDEGAWTIPKGLIEDDEAPFDAARREFEEETGIRPPSEKDAYVDLGTVKQSSRKRVAAWAMKADVDPEALESNRFEIEWPPDSGTTQEFLELDRAAYLPLDEAAEKIVEGQRPFLDRLREALSTEG
ncbi:MAG: NUDIX domain-containing protein [Salinibacter sp.]|uniref:NUDIX domain-containing protein n=1 Tax=Salinibacter sp. TaxID=2065818 RepID=UPI0035D4BCF4